MHNKQLPLGFSIRDYADFSGFFAPVSMRLVKSTLQQFVNDSAEDNIYLSGVTGTGKSHLLQAVCHLADEIGKTSIYFSLEEVKDYPPQDILDATESMEFLCLDDIDAIAGDGIWEEALFHLFNQRMTAQLPVYFAASLPAYELQVGLADLKSRLASCLTFQLPLLSDAEKVSLLQYRAQQLGMDLDETCALFIIKRSGRDIASLIEIVEKLDHESLSAARKITVPFIKSVFSW